MEISRPVCRECGGHLPAFDGDTEPKVVDLAGNPNEAFCPACGKFQVAIQKPA